MTHTGFYVRQGSNTGKTEGKALVALQFKHGLGSNLGALKFLGGACPHPFLHAICLHTHTEMASHHLENDFYTTVNVHYQCHTQLGFKLHTYICEEAR